MTNVEALKKVYVSLGGNLSDTYDDIADGATVGNMTLISDVIEAVSKKASTIEGLPPVSSTNNGKILKVVDGKQALADDEIQAQEEMNNDQ